MSQIELTRPQPAHAAHNGVGRSFDDAADGSHPPADWQRRVFRALGKQASLAIVLGILVAALAGAAGAWSVLRARTTWSSSAVMLIDDPPALATAGDDGELLKLDGLRTEYSALVNTELIARPVASKLHMPVGEVLGSVTATVPPEALLMDVSATWSNPVVAERLAQATANEVTFFVKYEGAAYNIPAVDRYTFKVIDPATVATADKPSHADALTLAVGLALAGFAVTFVVTQLWRHRRYIIRAA